MKTFDVAVIGGGIAGFIAANDLADAGKSVVVLEKSDRFGGRAMTVNKNGALFNLGGHALYRGGEAYSILQELGVKLEGKSPSKKVSAIWMNKVLPLPGDPLKLLSSRLLSWAGKMELGWFMGRLAKVDANALATTSLRDWTEQEIRDPMVRHIFYALCRTSTYVHDPNYAVAAPVIKQVQRALKSNVLYLDGGWQTIVDQLRERAVYSGVTILNNQCVIGIEHDGEVRRLAYADGSTMDISNVVSTVSPAETCRWITDAQHTMLQRWKDEARPSMAACLDLCLKRLPVAGRNVAIGLDQPVFFSNHSARAKLSDNGTLVMHLIKYNGCAKSDPNADRRVLEETMSLLHPDWQKEVVAQQYLPNMVVVHNYPHMGQTDPFPGPVVPEIRGLYVAGDWASHGEMLTDAAAASARRAVQHIL